MKNRPRKIIIPVTMLTILILFSCFNSVNYRTIEIQYEKTKQSGRTPVGFSVEVPESMEVKKMDDPGIHFNNYLELDVKQENLTTANISFGYFNEGNVKNKKAGEQLMDLFLKQLCSSNNITSQPGLKDYWDIGENETYSLVYILNSKKLGLEHEFGDTMILMVVSCVFNPCGENGLTVMSLESVKDDKSPVKQFKKSEVFDILKTLKFKQDPK